MDEPRCATLPLPFKPFSESVQPIGDVIRIEQQVLPLVQKPLVIEKFSREMKRHDGQAV